MKEFFGIRKPDVVVCVSKRDDYVLNQFAKGCKGKIEHYAKYGKVDLKLDKWGENPVFIIRGILRTNLISECRRQGYNFFYIDTGYIGNFKGKIWHRVTLNDLQWCQNFIIPLPQDRFSRTETKIQPWKKRGECILVCPPSAKSGRYFGINVDDWIDQTMATLHRYTDRPIRLRYKQDRMAVPFRTSVANNVFATVTHNSIVAVESVVCGVPTFVTGPNAALPVASTDLSKIDKPYYPDHRQEWLNHLAYCQFTIDEFANGTAWRIIRDFYQMA